MTVCTRLIVYRVNLWTSECLFHLVLRPFQCYFSSYEADQSVGVAKTEETLAHYCKQNLPCLKCTLCEARNHTRIKGEVI